MSFNKMDPKFKEEFVTALRSGEFKQSCGRTLRDHEGYCCLGVASVVLDRGEYDLHGYTWTEDCWRPLGEGRSWYRIIPPNISDDLGMDSELQVQLYDFNDLHGRSFDQIADWIEKNL